MLFFFACIRRSQPEKVAALDDALAALAALFPP